MYSVDWVFKWDSLAGIFLSTAKYLRVQVFASGLVAQIPENSYESLTISLFHRVLLEGLRLKWAPSKRFYQHIRVRGTNHEVFLEKPYDWSYTMLSMFMPRQLVICSNFRGALSDTIVNPKIMGEKLPPYNSKCHRGVYQTKMSLWAS